MGGPFFVFPNMSTSPFVRIPKCASERRPMENQVEPGGVGERDSCAMATDQSISGEPANMIKHQRALVSAVAPGLRLLHLLLLCDSGSSRSVSTISPPPPPPSLRSLPSPLISITSSSFLYLLVTFHNGYLPSALRLSIFQPDVGERKNSKAQHAETDMRLSSPSPSMCAACMLSG